MQTKKQSLFEAIANVVVGYFVALLGQIVVFPLVGLSVNIEKNLVIGLCFTGISIVRSFLLRRFFNWLHK